MFSSSFLSRHALELWPVLPRRRQSALANLGLVQHVPNVRYSSEEFLLYGVKPRRTDSEIALQNWYVFSKGIRPKCSKNASRPVGPWQTEKKKKKIRWIFFLFLLERHLLWRSLTARFLELRDVSLHRHCQYPCTRSPQGPHE